MIDEPMNYFDKKSADEIIELLLEVNRRGNTVLLVTHDEKYADMCTKKFVIEDGELIM